LPRIADGPDRGAATPTSRVCAPALAGNSQSIAAITAVRGRILTTNSSVPVACFQRLLRQDLKAARPRRNTRICGLASSTSLVAYCVPPYITLGFLLMENHRC